MSYYNGNYKTDRINIIVDNSYLPQEYDQVETSLPWSWSSIYNTSSQYVGTVTDFFGNTIASIGSTVASIGYTSYPKENVEPHIFPQERTTMCDYSGKNEQMVYATRVLYERWFGIIHSVEKKYQAQQDCYKFCKRIMAYPISSEFLTKNGYSEIYFGESGGCKNWRIVNNTTTLFQDGIIHIRIDDGSQRIFISMKIFCELNKINFKQFLERLEVELKNWYQITDLFA
jgi:hypothetical protein